MLAPRMDDLLEMASRGGWGIALGVGIGVALLVSRGLRPMAKEAVKGYLAASEGLRQATAGARESLQEIYSEARAEREAAARPQASETPSEP